MAKSAVLLLFLFLLQLVPATAEAQRNQTKETSSLGRFLIAPSPLPDSVYRAQEKKIYLVAHFQRKGPVSEGDPLLPATYTSTGFVVGTYVLTAGHLIMDSVSLLKSHGLDFELNNGIPQGIDYEYTFRGRIIVGSITMDFPLTLVAIDVGSTRDILALKPEPSTLEFLLANPQILNAEGRLVRNPLVMLTEPHKLTDMVELNEQVFISGYSGDGQSDLIDFTFPGTMVAKIEKLAVNQNGVRRLYRVLGKVEPGFSGGPMFNKKGEVLGMHISASYMFNFVYVISSEDIRDFLRDHKLAE